MTLPEGYTYERGDTTTGKPYLKVCHRDGTCAMRIGAVDADAGALVELIEANRRLPRACEESGDAS